MPIKQIYIHIGLPKSYSTSLQTLLSSLYIDRQINYFGFCPSIDHTKWYRDKVIARLLDYDLRVTNKSSFNTQRENYIDYFHREFSLNDLPVWISSENLSTRFTISEICPEEKVERLTSIFRGCQINFVVFLRPLRFTFPSIYKEYVKRGYTMDFNYFIDELFALDELNFLKSFFPGHLYTLLKEYSPKSSIAFFYTEFDLDEAGKFTQFLSSTLPDSHKRKPILFPLVNKSIQNNETLSQNIEFNQRGYQHIDSTGLLETHRILYYSDSFEMIKWTKLKKQRSFRRQLSTQPQYKYIKNEQLSRLKMPESKIILLNNKYFEKDLAVFADNKQNIHKYLDYWNFE